MLLFCENLLADNCNTKASWCVLLAKQGKQKHRWVGLIYLHTHPYSLGQNFPEREGRDLHPTSFKTLLNKIIISASTCFMMCLEGVLKISEVEACNITGPQPAHTPDKTQICVSIKITGCFDGDSRGVSGYSRHTTPFSQATAGATSSLVFYSSGWPWDVARLMVRHLYVWEPVRALHFQRALSSNPARDRPWTTFPLSDPPVTRALRSIGSSSNARAVPQRELIGQWAAL